MHFNNIDVKGIFREDFSAKDFNRPEWKRLIATIKKSRSHEHSTILFLKWDRFSRNIEYAYEMIGILRNLNTTAMSIDQPIDFDVPESSVMLAVYLSILESENLRRALNTANGIRRAKQLGRYPNKAPLGYVNLTGVDGKKYIAPSAPVANIIRWSFSQISKNAFTIEEIRRIALTKGLKCSRSNFWRLIHNPVYCGYVRLSTQTEGTVLIKGVHDPIISESLFYKVQDIVGSPKKVMGKSDELKARFPLKGFLTCPDCSRKLRASYSRGRSKRYPYYHCSGHCKTRFSADLVNESYYMALQQFVLSGGAVELFRLILEDRNTGSSKTRYLSERKALLGRLEEQEALISKARKLFVEDKLRFDDFRVLKKEYQDISGILQREFNIVRSNLRRLDKQLRQPQSSPESIFKVFKYMDNADRKQLVNLMPPGEVGIRTGGVSLKINGALAKVLQRKF